MVSIALPKKTKDKYQAIIDAAIKVIAEHGYHNAQVAKIAREAGVAEGTIYLYFQNKEDVLVRNELQKTKEPLEKLRMLIQMHFSKLEANRDLAAVLQIQLRQSHPTIRQRITEPLKGYYRLIEEIIAEGISKNVFRQNLNVYLTRQVIFGSMDEVATCWVMAQRPYSLAAQVPAVFDLLMHAICKRNPGNPENCC
ncbi:MAG: TetR/AcrR family transcriptional regulator [Desulfotomaculales bacterium]